MSSSAPSSSASPAEPSTPSQEPPQREDWELQRDAEKVLADQAFRAGDFASAVAHYTQALSLDPTHVVLLSNRSAAYLKRSEKSKALNDAKACVEQASLLKEKNSNLVSKAHSRLAAALHSLGRWEAAAEAYQTVLKIDSKNAGAIKGLEECQCKIKEKQEREETEQQQQRQEQTSTESSDKPQATDTGNTEKEEESDLLDDFFNEVEEVGKPQSNNDDDEDEDEAAKTNKIRNQRTNLGSAQSQIERLLAPNYKWRNLNPFYVLDLAHDATEDEISQRYKALSLLLHPDKCRSLDKAKEAYDQVQAAKTQLYDKNKRNHVFQLIVQGHKQGKSDWKKAQAAASTTGTPVDSCEEFQSKAVQRIFAEVEHKRKQVEERERKQEQRKREQEQEELRKERSERKFDKDWRNETRVESRIGSWRDFQKKGGPATKKQKL